jgi:hypothetical protein
MGNTYCCNDKASSDVPDNVAQGDLADSARRPRERNKVQHGGAHGFVNTEGT